jgi:hypothetical protein
MRTALRGCGVHSGVSLIQHSTERTLTSFILLTRDDFFILTLNRLKNCNLYIAKHITKL